ncbi:STAS domain-containing protein [Aestuariispira insulae]|uniref:Anti-sigma factor antagonist n=1 Tax=Aestuariispira insulae TaxID=1461337 RepID=A0A3D9HUW2_9PROT|nr:STAS domain-containing protein [Aestuariispira insulae]RED53229.1 anti-sigma B factor antagonist/stage II sporulation protein AA (anti-sigma F factor antagonist) [Aestuariispira insulae]
MEIREESSDGVLVLVPVDRVDGATAQAFSEKLDQAAARGERSILLDFSELKYISSTGLRAVLTLAKKSKASGSGFAVCSLIPHIREVFDMSGFSRIMTLAEDREAAYRALSN